MADLARLRLCAYPHRNPLPKAVEKCCTVVSVDESVATGPAYPSGGSFIEEIIAGRKIWLDEDSYLAHVQEVLLCIAIKAFLYYYLCCVGVSTLGSVPQEPSSHPSAAPTAAAAAGQQLQIQQSGFLGEERRKSRNKSLLPPPSPSISPALGHSLQPPSPKLGLVLGEGQEGMSDVGSSMGSSSPLQPTQPAPGTQQVLQTMYSLLPVKPSVRENAKVRFWRDMDIRPGDRDIVEHLAEVVKEQQVWELRSHTQVAPVILDYSPCQLFRNVVQQGRQ
jgi:hypothetical protein